MDPPLWHLISAHGNTVLPVTISCNHPWPLSFSSSNSSSNPHWLYLQNISNNPDFKHYSSISQLPFVQITIISHLNYCNCLLMSLPANSLSLYYLFTTYIKLFVSQIWVRSYQSYVPNLQRFTSQSEIPSLYKSLLRASQVVLVVNKPPASAGRWRDVGSLLGQEDPLEEGMATHSSILAWRIPQTEELGKLQSMGSQRVRHNWSSLAHTYA